MLEYMTLSQTERQQHLDLSEPCVEIGGNSIQFRALLAHTVKSKIPQKREAVLCHACHNSACSNPRHLYWGTYSENLVDSFKNGRKPIQQYIAERTAPTS